MTSLLEVDRLRIDARQDDDSLLPIVKDVTFNVEHGEVVALIGESGSGKTTIALATLGYTKPGLEFSGGEVRLHGKDVITMAAEEKRQLRGQRVAYLAQSAAATFNPTITIGEQVTESAVLHGLLSKEEAHERAELLYRELELPDPDRLGKRYPHQVSGGQLQRLMAAMALCGKPDLLVLDEPTTALDVTVQAQILELIEEMRVKFGTAVLIITHNLGVVARYVERLNVMYAGSLIETGATDEVYARPHHPYTKGLLQSVPRLDRPRSQNIEVIEGMPPDLTNLPSGCPFAERCSFVMPQCRKEKPNLKEVGLNHFSACFLEYSKLD